MRRPTTTARLLTLESYDDSEHAYGSEHHLAWLAGRLEITVDELRIMRAESARDMQRRIARDEERRRMEASS